MLETSDDTLAGKGGRDGGDGEGGRVGDGARAGDEERDGNFAGDNGRGTCTGEFDLDRCDVPDGDEGSRGGAFDTDDVDGVRDVGREDSAGVVGLDERCGDRDATLGTELVAGSAGGRPRALLRALLAGSVSIAVYTASEPSASEAL